MAIPTGFTIKRVEPISTEVVFRQALPTAKPCASHTVAIAKRNAAPNKPLSELAKDNPKLAAILALASSKAKECAALEAGDKPAKRRNVTKLEGGVVEAPKTKGYAAPPEYDSSYIVGDEEFIRRIRGVTNVHDKEAIKLFYANGGSAYLVHDITYALALDSLRHDVLRRIHGSAKIPNPDLPRRNLPHSCVTFTPGLTGAANAMDRYYGELEGSRRKANAVWAGIPHK